MRVEIAIALVCIAVGVFYTIVPDFLKYGWRGKYPLELKLLSKESYKRYMRRVGVALIIIGLVIFCISLIK